jgi:putative endonuclease|tara:strand:- start:157 stop:588 length:432 start_codon:yes stop_codon:yes gene_type:complete
MSIARAAATLTVSAAAVGTSGVKRRTGWFVYVVETKSGKLYTGVTIDVKRRLEQHAGWKAGGAKALRGDPPVRLRYAETAVDRSQATRREIAIKKMPRAKKLELVETRVDVLSNATKPGNVISLSFEELKNMDPVRVVRDDER